MYAQRDYSNQRGRGTPRGRGRGTSRGGRGGNSYVSTHPTTVETIATPELQKHSYPAYFMIVKNTDTNRDIKEILKNYFSSTDDYKFRVVEKNETQTFSILITKKSLMEKFELSIAEKNVKDVEIKKMVLDENSFPTKFNNPNLLKIMRPNILSRAHCINVITSLIQFFEDCGILTDETPEESKKDRSNRFISSAVVTIPDHAPKNYQSAYGQTIVNFKDGVDVRAIVIFKLFCNANIWFDQNHYKLGQMKTYWM